MRTASSPALRAPPIDTVATGTPAGICTIDSSESMPSRYFSGTGTPITGSGVSEATMPGRWAAPPAPAMITFSPRPAACCAYVGHAERRAVRRDDPHLVRHVELGAARRRPRHHRPVGVRLPMMIADRPVIGASPFIR